ncbi:hypothetical protein PIB30_073160 [Stylosanthes scabra]|uniref:F-box domain-containing protein n=1 Tax=Stylosanthes scabra TaxID=79078 RepID=A0ABU6WMN0_9FABA|nr:hypothetical protein [Stylosanthes scabra]
MMHGHESADAVLGNIDLLAKILHHLPVKDLLRSKCVCKKWRWRKEDEDEDEETGSWSKHDVVPSLPNDIKILKNDGVYCNGAIHWYVLRGTDTIRAPLSLYFDIDRLCLKSLPTLPFTLPYSFIHGAYFVECRGNLHLIAKSSMQENIYSIWELKEDYSGWIQKYTLNLTTLTTLTTLLSSSLRSLCVVSQPPNEDEEDESMLAILLVGKDTVMSYNLEDHSSRIIYQGDAGSSLGGQYFETLVSISPGYNKIQ